MDIGFEIFMAVYSQRLNGTTTQKTTIYTVTDVQQNSRISHPVSHIDCQFEPVDMYTLTPDTAKLPGS
jgi:hypothetical protein